MPEIGTPPELKLPKLQRVTLSNGLKVILAERHEIPVVDFWLQLDAGYAADQFASPGTASMTTALLDGGTEKHTALEISAQRGSVGGAIDAPPRTWIPPPFFFQRSRPTWTAPSICSPT